MAASDVAAAVRMSVVEIKTETVTSGGWLGPRVSEGAGSGVVISSDGYVITNHHVIEDSATITVRLADGREYDAVLVGTDPRTDIAVVKINETGLSAAVFGDSTTLVVGESALAVGNPLGELGGTVTGGIISALDRDIVVDGEPMTLLQTDAAVNPGNSGGGLFNLRAELIGVVVAKSSGLDIEGLGFAIPSNTAAAVANDLISIGYVSGRVDMGFELIDIQTVGQARRYNVSHAGMYIVHSGDNRFRSGDRIVSINGAPVSDRLSYNTALIDFQIGDEVWVSVVRGNETMTFEVTLTEWTP